MTKNYAAPSILYLHGGPGMSADLESEWFGDAFPVLWWNQPRFAVATPNAFSPLVNAAESQLVKMANATGGQVGVISSSFGARIAIELAYRQSNHLHSLTLLAPTLRIEEGLMRLASYLLSKEQGGALLLSTYSEAIANRSHDAFLHVVTALFSMPDLLSHYWAEGTEALQRRHSQMLEKVSAWFDMDTFIAISRDLFELPLPANPVSGLPIVIFAGKNDPMFAESEDRTRWEILFPHATVSVVDAGHMVPFECPIRQWLPTLDL